MLKYHTTFVFCILSERARLNDLKYEEAMKKAEREREERIKKVMEEDGETFKHNFFFTIDEIKTSLFLQRFPHFNHVYYFSNFM